MGLKSERVIALLDALDKARGEAAMLRSALEEKTREHTHAVSLLTKTESERDEARAEVVGLRKSVLEEAATVVLASNCVDGPKGTIEGQLASALRALAEPK